MRTNRTFWISILTPVVLLVIQMAYWSTIWVQDSYKQVNLPSSDAGRVQVTMSSSIIEPLAWATLLLFGIAIIVAFIQRSYAGMGVIAAVTLTAYFLFAPLLTDVLDIGLIWPGALALTGLLVINMGTRRYPQHVRS
jgi:hypothetical protein